MAIYSDTDVTGAEPENTTTRGKPGILLTESSQIKPLVKAL